MSTQEPTSEQIVQIGDALAAGRKIEAIKIYREATGKDLGAAKEFIEALIPRLQQQDPERFAALSASNQGCPFSVVFLLLLIGFGIALALTLVRFPALG